MPRSLLILGNVLTKRWVGPAALTVCVAAAMGQAPWSWEGYTPYDRASPPLK